MQDYTDKSYRCEISLDSNVNTSGPHNAYTISVVVFYG
jgi:hypothetical protein